MQAKDFKVEEISTVITNPATVAVEDLKNSGASSAATYGIKEGDTIEFLESYNDPKAITGRKITNKNMTPEQLANAPVEVLVGVLRNGQPDWYSLADCRRQDIDMKPVDEFRASMLKFNNDLERLNALVGTTIKAGEKIEYNVVKAFERNADGRMTPVLGTDGKPEPRARVTYEVEWIKPTKK